MKHFVTTISVLEQINVITLNNMKDCKKDGHNWKTTYCGDGCKVHPGTWRVCLRCNKKERII